MPVAVELCCINDESRMKRLVPDRAGLTSTVKVKLLSDTAPNR